MNRPILDKSHSGLPGVKMRPNEILYNKSLNKSTAFTREERKKYGLQGLLPYAISNQDTQVKRVIENLNRKNSDIEKYIMLAALQDRNERLFYRTAMEHIEQIIPLIYTPTVGQACKEFSHIYRREHGFYLTPDDRGQIKENLKNWPADDIAVIVISDGSRILGLGDLGANGMGIPIGKLELYTVCAGIHPGQCLPVLFDVGTNNEELLNDSLYLGYPSKRLPDPEYYSLMEEFIEAVTKRYPNALVQFEDFQTEKAFGLLHKYRDKILCFNDDIQGTAAVTLAGIYSSQRITGKNLKDIRVLFFGGGAAATGIADLIVGAMASEGISIEEARNNVRIVDSRGLVVKSRIGTKDDLAPHKIPFAVDEQPADFISAIDRFQPDALIGASGASGSFTREVIEKMSRINERPVIFALSNPTSKAECTAEDAYTYSNGRVVFASGSPFDTVKFNGKEYYPSQGNNVYIFPGVGLGAVIGHPKKITDEMFQTAARTLASVVSDEEIQRGGLYPSLQNIREVSAKIAEAVIERSFEQGLTGINRQINVPELIKYYMYNPHY
jgi:malate dehydrogenase (oxaloacetate-decarboxylating)(NADP+)